MAAVSVLLAFTAFLGLAFGLAFTLVPIWGLVFSFAAPVVALLGIVLGGLEMSAANKRGQSSGFALAGVIMNVLAFLPALVIAMTCGVCNACVTTQGGQQQHLRMLMPPQAQPVINPVSAPPPFQIDAAIKLAPDAGSGLPPPPMAPGPTR
jgi:hypothetical protein